MDEAQVILKVTHRARRETTGAITFVERRFNHLAQQAEPQS